MPCVAAKRPRAVRNLAKQYPRKAIGNASGLSPILEGGLTYFCRRHEAARTLNFAPPASV
jgi:hypothetical protein